MKGETKYKQQAISDKFDHNGMLTADTGEWENIKGFLMDKVMCIVPSVKTIQIVSKMKI